MAAMEQVILPGCFSRNFSNQNGSAVRSRGVSYGAGGFLDAQTRAARCSDSFFFFFLV